MTEDVSKLLETDIQNLSEICRELLRRNKNVAMLYHLRLMDMVSTGSLIIQTYDIGRQPDSAAPPSDDTTHKPN